MCIIIIQKGIIRKSCNKNSTHLVRSTGWYKDGISWTLCNAPSPNTMLPIQSLSEVKVQVHELVVNGIRVGRDIYTSLLVHLTQRKD